jgi:glycosyltransferase involved in cell wall biosynthesis
MSLDGLVIVQNRVTQFDAPLYGLIHRSARFPISVIYTTPSAQGSQLDHELGFTPGWDHLSSHDYPQQTLHSTSPLAIWRLARQLARQKPGLVVISGYYPRSHLLLAVLLRLRGQRIGLRSDNTLEHTVFRGPTGPLRKLVIGFIQRLFHTWHPVGQQAHAYLRFLSRTERPTYRFPYAVDNDWFASQSSKARHERASFLQQQGWPADAFVVLGIMKWTSREDPLTLVSAFAELCHRVPNLRLILVGDGPLRDDVYTACAPMRDRVCLPGYVPYSQLPVMYGRANIFVHPAPSEPWGVSVTEALACGLPVLAAEGVGAAHELLTTELCGSIFPNASSEALAEQLASYSDHATEFLDRTSDCLRAADCWHYRFTIQSFERALAAK